MITHTHGEGQINAHITDTNSIIKHRQRDRAAPTDFGMGGTGPLHRGRPKGGDKGPMGGD